MNEPQIYNLPSQYFKPRPSLAYTNIAIASAEPKKFYIFDTFNRANFFLKFSYSVDAINGLLRIEKDLKIQQIRAYFLYSAIVWYDCCCDLFLKVVAIANRLIPHNYFDKNEYDKADEQTKYNEFKKHNPDFKKSTLEKLLAKYYFSESFKKVREWANTLKHSRILDIEETSILPFIKVYYKEGEERAIGFLNQSGNIQHRVFEKKVFELRDYEKEIEKIPMREIIDTLIQYNNLFIEMIKRYEGMLEIDLLESIKKGERFKFGRHSSSLLEEKQYKGVL